MLAWFFILTSMTWDGTVSNTFVGPFPSETSCMEMRDHVARRVVTQQWIQVATMEKCAYQEPK
jgi:hypothetical protein